MISKYNWLNTNIQYEDNYKIKDVFNIIIEKVYNSIFQLDLDISCDYLTFKENFISSFYDLYFNKKEIIIKNDFDIENFDFLYGNYIFNLYKDIQEITRFYNLDYFHGYKESYVDLLYFISNHIYFNIEDDNDKESEEELFIEEEYY